MPDSKIETQFKSKRTKTKCIVRNALAPHFHQQLVLSLQSTQFSVIIDETTDISTCKELAVVTRLYDKETMSTKCCFYDLLEVSQGDAETLSQVFRNVLEMK